MRQKIHLFILVLVVNILHGQSPLTKIYGQATERNSRKAIADLDITLVYADSLKFRVRTDSNGTYSFFVSKEIITPKTKLDAWYDILSYRKIKEKDTTCHFINTFWGYMEHPSYLIHDSLKNGQIQCDFTLTQVVSCPRLPTIYFEKNSTDMTVDFQEDSAWQQPTQQLKYLTCVLSNNRELVLSIEGHSSVDEKNPHKISADRATLIREYFANHGIEKDRLVTKSWGPDKPVITQNQLKRAKTKADKNTLLSRNRYVSFRVLSYDYGQ